MTAPVRRDPERALLARFRRRTRAAISVDLLGVLALHTALVVFATYAIDRSLRLGTSLRVSISTVAALWLVRIVWRKLLVPASASLDDRELALAYERIEDSLHQQLISGIQFREALAGDQVRGESRPMMLRAIEQLRQRLLDTPVTTGLDRRRLLRATATALLGLAVVASFAGAFPREFGLWFRRNVLFTAAEWPRATQLFILDTPTGSLHVAAGDDVEVRIAASGTIPDQVRLDVQDTTNRRITLLAKRAPNLDASGRAIYRAAIQAVGDDLQLRARGGDGLSPQVSVRVVARPVLDPICIEIIEPAYLGRNRSRMTVSGGAVAVPEGGEIRCTATSTKDLDSARARLNDKDLSVDIAKREIQFSASPRANGALTLEAIDVDGVSLAAPTRIAVQVLPDEPPTVSLTAHAIGSLVSARAKIPCHVRAFDDRAIVTAELLWAIEHEGATDRTPTWKLLREADLAPLLGPSENRRTLQTVDLMQSIAAEASDNVYLSLRAQVVDSAGQSVQTSPTTFRIVPRERLIEEFQRRRSEQREILQGAREEFADTRAHILDGAAQQDLGTLVEGQRAATARVEQTADALERLLTEAANNRLFDDLAIATQRRQVVQPLRLVVSMDCVRLLERTSSLAPNGSTKPVRDLYDRVLAELDSVLACISHDDSIENIAEDLQSLLQLQDEIRTLVTTQRDRQAEALFGPGTPSNEKGK